MIRVDKHGNPTSRRTYGERYSNGNIAWNLGVMAAIILVGMVIGESLVVSAFGWFVGWHIGLAIAWLLDGAPRLAAEPTPEAIEPVRPKVEIFRPEKEWDVYER